jgi:hypothetical protein
MARLESDMKLSQCQRVPQVVTKAQAADQFQGELCCHPRNFLLGLYLINADERSINIECKDNDDVCIASIFVIDQLSTLQGACKQMQTIES